MGDSVRNFKIYFFRLHIPKFNDSFAIKNEKKLDEVTHVVFVCNNCMAQYSNKRTLWVINTHYNKKYYLVDDFFIAKCYSCFSIILENEEKNILDNVLTIGGFGSFMKYLINVYKNEIDLEDKNANKFL